MPAAFAIAMALIALAERALEIHARREQGLPSGPEDDAFLDKLDSARLEETLEQERGRQIAEKMRAEEPQ
jgi:hypothetical protein